MNAPHAIAGDGAILSRFAAWIEGHRAVVAMPCGLGGSPEKAAWEAALEKADVVESEIADTPADGAAGMAVKAYILAFYQTGGTNEEAAALGDFPHEDAIAALSRSLIGDCVRVVPALGPLASRLLGTSPATAPAADSSMVPERDDPFALGGWEKAEPLAEREVLERRYHAVPEKIFPEEPIHAGMPGGHPDAPLLNAERNLAILLRLSRESDQSDAVQGPIWDRLSSAEDLIAKTPPVTLVGAAVKLRLLCDPEIGLEAGEAEHELPSLRQVLALVEREAALQQKTPGT